MTKPFFRIPVAALAAASFFLLGNGLTFAADDDPARHAAAEKLVAAMHTEQMVNGNINQLIGYMDQMDQRALQGRTITPEQTNEIKKAKDEASATIHKELGFDSVKEEFVKTYADSFSEQELKDLTAFYNSPVGQKMFEKQPQINKTVGLAAQKKMQEIMPGIAQKLAETIQKVLPPPPAPEPLEPSAPAAGGPVPPAPAPRPNMPPAPPTGDPAAPAPPKAPVPPAPPVTVTTPPVSANPAPPVPTPPPTASGAPTPAVQ